MYENEAEILTEMEKIMDERLEQEKKDIIAMLDKTREAIRRCMEQIDRA